jgi:hypothetical protein
MPTITSKTREDKSNDKETLKTLNPLAQLCKGPLAETLEGLGRVTDARDASKTTYSMGTVMETAVLSLVLRSPSGRRTNAWFADKDMRAGLVRLTGAEGPTIPHGDTINNVFRRTDPLEVQAQETGLCKSLILTERKMLVHTIGMAFVALDGSGIHSFGEWEHCPDCLTRKVRRADGTEGTEHFHHVLEAKLVASDGRVVSLASEWIDNEGQGGFEKQDCEIKAFKRLHQRIADALEGERVCVLGDALYACAPAFAICRQHGWDFIITLKEGRLPTVHGEFQELSKACEPLMARDASGSLEYRFVEGIEYALDNSKAKEHEGRFMLNALSCKVTRDTGLEKAQEREEKAKARKARMEKEKAERMARAEAAGTARKPGKAAKAGKAKGAEKAGAQDPGENKGPAPDKEKKPKVTKFTVVTSLHVDRGNVAMISRLGRMRWSIENQGFNTQKTQAMNIEHCRSKDPTAMKVWYAIAQIAHTILTLLFWNEAVAEIAVRDGHCEVQRLARDWVIEAGKPDSAFVLLS